MKLVFRRLDAHDSMDCSDTYAGSIIEVDLRLMIMVFEEKKILLPYGVVYVQQAGPASAGFRNASSRPRCESCIRRH